MAKGFRDFIMRGNVIELAIAVVIGTAFTAVVTAFVKDLLTPLIAAIGGKTDFSTLAFTINNSTFKYGDFTNAVFAFATVAATVYFIVVAPMNRLAERRRQGTEELSTRDCPECLSTIPKAARRCSFCAELVGVVLDA